MFKVYVKSHNYFSGKPVTHSLFGPHNLGQDIQRIHATSTLKFPPAMALKLPTNVDINATDVSGFSPQRERDILGPVIDSCCKKQNVLSGIDITVQADAHVNKYDCRGAVSLNSSMQSNVPRPFSGDNTHLNMPGSQWGQGQKYLSGNLQSAHYLTLRNDYRKSARNDGTSWGASADCLRTSALALVYSTAEYCAPTWMNSAHTQSIDTQLNHTMRLITGCMKPTPGHWLPALSGIAPPHLRRLQHLLREIDKIRAKPDLPINTDLATFRSPRLKSRNPPALLSHEPPSQWNIQSAWKQEWTAKAESEELFAFDPRNHPQGFKEARHVWCSLNRVRTGIGHCAYLRKKWGWGDAEGCDCGHPKQTVHHIVFDCPLTKYDGPPLDFKDLTSDAVDYLTKCRFRL